MPEPMQEDSKSAANAGLTLIDFAESKVIFEYLQTVPSVKNDLRFSCMSLQTKQLIEDIGNYFLLEIEDGFTAISPKGNFLVPTTPFLLKNTDEAIKLYTIENFLLEAIYLLYYQAEEHDEKIKNGTIRVNADQKRNFQYRQRYIIDYNISRDTAAQFTLVAMVINLHRYMNISSKSYCRDFYNTHNIHFLVGSALLLAHQFIADVCYEDIDTVSVFGWFNDTQSCNLKETVLRITNAKVAMLEALDYNPRLMQNDPVVRNCYLEFGLPPLPPLDEFVNDQPSASPVDLMTTVTPRPDHKTMTDVKSFAMPSTSSVSAAAILASERTSPVISAAAKFTEKTLSATPHEKLAHFYNYRMG